MENKNGRASGAYLLLLLLLFAGVLWFTTRVSDSGEDYQYQEFVSDVKSGDVKSVVITQNEEVPTGSLAVTLKGEDGTRSVNVSDVTAVQELLDDNDVGYDLRDVSSDELLTTILVSGGLLVLAVVAMIFIMNRSGAGSANMKAMNFGKNRAKLNADPKHRVTFADVAGLSVQKEELE